MHREFLYKIEGIQFALQKVREEVVELRLFQKLQEDNLRNPSTGTLSKTKSSPGFEEEEENPPLLDLNMDLDETVHLTKDTQMSIFDVTEQDEHNANELMMKASAMRKAKRRERMSSSSSRSGLKKSQQSQQ
jgi:hypothetical protein